MTERKMRITHSDITKLRKLFRAGRRSSGPDLRYLETLKAEVECAEIIEDTRIPGDVITMHSRVLLQDLNTGQNNIYILVFPREADLSLNKVSVLAPIGTALLGYRTGDIIEWNTPGGVKRFVVRDVLYQPEASGEEMRRATSSPASAAVGPVLRAVG